MTAKPKRNIRDNLVPFLYFTNEEDKNQKEYNIGLKIEQLFSNRANKSGPSRCLHFKHKIKSLNENINVLKSQFIFCPVNKQSKASPIIITPKWLTPFLTLNL